jgi:predicted nucleic-acid-binding Zn-ribbon protein
LLLISDGVADTVLFDVENNKYKDMSYRKEDTSQVDFRDNSSFYASYGATFDITKGGYLPETLGLFDISDDRFISKFSPYGKISCWVHDKEHGLLVTLLNGDIYLLDHLLDIQHKWHINDYIKTCGQGANGDIWLGSVKTGLYKASFREKNLTHEYSTNKTINSVEASLDGRYLGITEAFHGQTKVTVFAVD